MSLIAYAVTVVIQQCNERLDAITGLINALANLLTAVVAWKAMSGQSWKKKKGKKKPR